LLKERAPQDAKEIIRKVPTEFVEHIGFTEEARELAETFAGKRGL